MPKKKLTQGQNSSKLQDHRQPVYPASCCASPLQHGGLSMRRKPRSSRSLEVSARGEWHYPPQPLCSLGAEMCCPISQPFVGKIAQADLCQPRQCWSSPNFWSNLPYRYSSVNIQDVFSPLRQRARNRLKKMRWSILNVWYWMCDWERPL